MKKLNKTARFAGSLIGVPGDLVKILSRQGNICLVENLFGKRGLVDLSMLS